MDKTKEELQQMLEKKRAEYRDAKARGDEFMMKKIEWEGKYIKKWMESNILMDDPKAPIPSERVFEIASYIFG